MPCSLLILTFVRVTVVITVPQSGNLLEFSKSRLASFFPPNVANLRISMNHHTNRFMPIEQHEMIGRNDENILMSKVGKNRDLPEGFTPSEMDVICGWARQNYHHG